MGVTTCTPKVVFVPAEELKRCFLPKEDRGEELAAGLGASGVVVCVNALSVAFHMVLGLGTNLRAISQIASRIGIINLPLADQVSQIDTRHPSKYICSPCLAKDLPIQSDTPRRHRSSLEGSVLVRDHLGR